MNPYKSLGVDSNATPEEIKKAYRAKASQAHPDRDQGNEEEMVNLNKAYAILSDPQKKIHYDTTGETSTVDPLIAVEQIVTEAFMNCLGAPNLIEAASYYINTLTGQHRNLILNLGVAKSKLIKRRNKVSTTYKTNIFHMIIDQQTNQIDAQVASAKRFIDLNEKALEIINQFTEESDFQTAWNSS